MVFVEVGGCFCCQGLGKRSGSFNNGQRGFYIMFYEIRRNSRKIVEALILWILCIHPVEEFNFKFWKVHINFANIYNGNSLKNVH